MFQLFENEIFFSRTQFGARLKFIKDSIEKRLEKELVEKAIYDGVLFAKEEKVGVKENGEPNEQPQIMRNYESKSVWKAKDDKDLGAKINEVDLKENTEFINQHQMKEGVSKTQKFKMKQEIMENGLKNKQHESFSEQLKVNDYAICNTVLNFHGDSEVELSRRKQVKQLKNMENKTVWKVTDKRHMCSKSDMFLLNKTTKQSEKQHMQGMRETAELSDKHQMEGMKETAELSEKQNMKEDSIPSKICKNSSNASQLSSNEFKIPIMKDNADKGAMNQSVQRVNDQQWMRKTNTK